MGWYPNWLRSLTVNQVRICLGVRVPPNPPKSGATHSKRSLQSHATHDDGTFVPFGVRRKGTRTKTTTYYPPVAQLVERLSEEQKVIGSIPILGG